MEINARGDLRIDRDRNKVYKQENCARCHALTKFLKRELVVTPKKSQHRLSRTV